MKLKYNIDGSTETIPLATRKKPGKRLAIHHDGQNYYAPVVEPNDPKASKLSVGVNGEIFAVQAQEPPEITAVNVAPSSVAVMQGQSATATVSAIGNDAITGLSYGLSGAPTWITISDDLIMIRPSDNDLGIANVQVLAQDTGSDAMSAAIFAAEAKLRPIIESLSVIPPAVTVMQGQSATASVSAVANSAVGGVRYSLGDAPNWMTLNNDVIIMEPTDNDLGTATVNVLANDINSSASAATQFVATAELRPKITNFNANPAAITVVASEKAYVTLSATANSAVESVRYSLDNAPSWMTLKNSVVTLSPAASNVGTVTVQATARDTGSTVQASTQFVATAKTLPKITNINIAYPTAASLQPRLGVTTTATVSAQAESGVSTSSITFELVDPPSWLSISGKKLTLTMPKDFTVTRGTKTFKLRATSPDAQALTKEFSVNVLGMVRTYKQNYPSVELSSGTGTAEAFTQCYSYSNLVEPALSQYAQGQAYFIGEIPTNSTITPSLMHSSISSKAYVTAILHYPKSNAGGSYSKTCSVGAYANDYYEAYNTTWTIGKMTSGKTTAVTITGS